MLVVIHRMLRLPYEVEVSGDDGSYAGPTITLPTVPAQNITTVWSTPDGTKIGISQYGVGTRLYDAVTGQLVPTAPTEQILVSSAVNVDGLGVGTTFDGHCSPSMPTLIKRPANFLASMAMPNRWRSVWTAACWSSRTKARASACTTSRGTQLGDAIPDKDGALGIYSIRADGQEIAIPYGAQGIALWDFDPEHWLDAACKVAGRSLTAEEWARYLGEFGPYHQTCTDGRANR